MENNYGMIQRLGNVSGQSSNEAQLKEIKSDIESLNQKIDSVVTNDIASLNQKMDLILSRLES